MNFRVRNHVSQKSRHVHVGYSVISESSDKWGNRFSDKIVDIEEVRELSFQGFLHNFIQSLIVIKDATVEFLLEKIVSSMGEGNDWSWYLCLLAIIISDFIHHLMRQSSSCSSTQRMQKHKALQTFTLFYFFPYFIRYLVSVLSANSVISSGVVVGCIFFAWN